MNTIQQKTWVIFNLNGNYFDNIFNDYPDNADYLDYVMMMCGM